MEELEMKRLLIAMCFVLAVAASAAAECTSTPCPTNPPGQRYPLIDWRFVNGGTLPQTYGVYLSEDIVSVKVEDGAPSGLTNNQMDIVLTTASGVTWKKEIAAFGSCSGIVPTISTHDSNHGPVRMHLNRTNCQSDTIILRKEKFLQGMINMYHFDPARLWRLWAGKIVTINWTQDFYWGSFPPTCTFPCVPVNTDSNAGILYDTDSKADVAAARPRPFSNILDWIAINSSTNVQVVKTLGNFSSDRPVPYDYDGDGRTDMAVWRRDTGEWFIINSLTGQLRVVQWGLNGDMPAPGDYDGDGKADLAVWRPSNGTWFIKSYITGATGTRQGGGSGDLEVAADYDGDHKTDPAVWNMFTGYWNIFTDPQRTQQWGLINDIQVPADYDGDGKTDFATWRDGVWWVKKSSNGYESANQWGMWGDLPEPADYDGDGKADMAIFRPWANQWWIFRSSDNTTSVISFGVQGDMLVSSK